MSIIKTAKYLVGSKPVPLKKGSNPKANSNLQYANVDEQLVKEGFLITKPNSYKLNKKIVKVRKSFPKCITHIFLHHTATNRNSSSKSIVQIFNKRKVCSHRTIEENGHEEILVDDKFKVSCQGVTGYAFNTSGMSVELIALGYVIDTPIEESDGIYYKQVPTHGKQYWVKKENTTLVVDFNGNPKPYKDYARWNAYTQPQVDATVKLIKEWGTTYKIPFVFNQKTFNNMFPEKAIPKVVKNTPGIYSHCSVVNKKRDIFPDPLLVAAFKKEFKPGNSLDFK